MAGLQKFVYHPGGLASGGALSLIVHELAGGAAWTRDARSDAETLVFVLGSAAEGLGTWEGVVIPRGVVHEVKATDEGTRLLEITCVDPRGGSGEAPGGVKTFAYDSPDLGDEAMVVPYLHDGEDMLFLSVEKVSKGAGDPGMHAHTGIVSAWYVLAGTVRFTDLEGATYDLGADEGLFIPAGAAYGFVGTSDEPLEILHIKARDHQFASTERVDYPPAS